MTLNITFVFFVFAYIHIIIHVWWNRDKCNDVVKCSWIYSSRHVSPCEEIINANCSWRTNTTKMMPFKSPLNCFWWSQEKDIWEYRQWCAKRLNAEEVTYQMYLTYNCSCCIWCYDIHHWRILWSSYRMFPWTL